MIEIHADDYALTLNTSKDILELIKDGVLDGISIIVNTSKRDGCIDLLLDAIPDLPFLPKMSVHLNLVEGKSLSSPDNRMITATWKSLFLASFIPFYRNVTKNHLKAEIAVQIEAGNLAVTKCIEKAKACNIRCDQKELRIDSHQHTHMIPVVWSALTEVIEENEYKVEYIRNSREPLGPFVNAKELIKTYRAVNLIKNRLLYILSYPVNRYCRNKGEKPMYLWGLMMSGRMDKDRASKLYDGLCKKSEKDGRDLEILFHPGRMTADEICGEIPRHSADDFYLSSDRDVEKAGAICIAARSGK